MFIIVANASGKSLIVYLLTRFNQLRIKNKILIVVPTTSLVEQLYKDFKDYGYDSDKHVHRIYGENSKETDKKLSYQLGSQYTHNQKYFSQFDMIIGDEEILYLKQYH